MIALQRRGFTIAHDFLVKAKQGCPKHTGVYPDSEAKMTSLDSCPANAGVCPPVNTSRFQNVRLPRKGGALTQGPSSDTNGPYTYHPKPPDPTFNAKEKRWTAKNWTTEIK